MRAPRTGDAARDRQAGILNFMLWVGLGIILVHISITLLLPSTQFLNLSYELLVALLQAVCLALLHLGKPRFASCSIRWACGWWCPCGRTSSGR